MIASAAISPWWDHVCLLKCMANLYQTPITSKENLVPWNEGYRDPGSW